MLEAFREVEDDKKRGEKKETKSSFYVSVLTVLGVEEGGGGRKESKLISPLGIIFRFLVFYNISLCINDDLSKIAMAAAAVVEEDQLRSPLHSQVAAAVVVARRTAQLAVAVAVPAAAMLMEAVGITSAAHWASSQETVAAVVAQLVEWGPVA